MGHEVQKKQLFVDWCKNMEFQPDFVAVFGDSTFMRSAENRNQPAGFDQINQLAKCITIMLTANFLSLRFT
jgi:hypothetical protein